MGKPTKIDAQQDCKELTTEKWSEAKDYILDSTLYRRSEMRIKDPGKNNRWDSYYMRT
jgi:hypothetical protein